MITRRTVRALHSLLLTMAVLPAVSRSAETDAPAARPSPAQYDWHEQERLMFVCIGVPTWEGSEYDADGQTDLSKMDPAAFDADRLCEVTKSWGAREILLVAKHVGGFCWWPTETTEYCTRSIPWRAGKGNLVQEVADACRRHGLSVGVYLYPDDTRFTTAIGRGGRTDDPAQQEQWSRLFRRQWEEVLAICGPDLVREVWLDGGCVIELGDILQRLAPNAVVFQGSSATIRWVGNEAGIARDPNWNSLKRADLLSGGATQDHSDPAGDAWAPVECDTTLYDHNWFWNPENEQKRKSVDQLLRLYVQSVGRGSVLLLNCTPNTSGEVPAGDQACYRELGEAIERNFGRPVASVKDVTGELVELDLGEPRQINCVDLWEDYQLGHRIRAYTLEGRAAGSWLPLSTGTAVGRRKLDFFASVAVDRIRVRITQSVGTPVLRLFQVHAVDEALARNYVPSVGQGRPARASSVHSPPYEACFLVDGDLQTRWGAADGASQPWIEIDLGRSRTIARATASELADRVRQFRIEVRNREEEPWRTAYEGTRIGEHWQTDFDRVTTRFVRLHILEYVGPAPTLWEFQVDDRAGAWQQVTAWQAGPEVQVDLSQVICEPGQYEVHFVTADGNPIVVESATLLLEGRAVDPSLLSGVGTDTLKLNRSQAVGDGASTAIRVALQAPAGTHGVVQFRATDN